MEISSSWASGAWPQSCGELQRAAQASGATQRRIHRELSQRDVAGIAALSLCGILPCRFLRHRGTTQRTRRSNRYKGRRTSSHPSLSTSQRDLTCRAAAVQMQPEVARALAEALGSQRPEQAHRQDGGDAGLRVLLVAMGTRGDVEPCLRLATALKERGHVPVVFSLDAYEAEISGKWGLDFRSSGIAKIPISTAYLQGQTRADQVYADRTWYRDAWVEVGERMFKAATEDEGCDIIVATSMGNTHALDVAERLGLLCLALKFCPDIDGQVPTGSFAPSGYPALPGPLNVASHVLENLRTIGAVMLGGFIPAVISFRMTMGLPSQRLPGGVEVPAYSPYRQQLQANQPCLYSFGTELVDRPPEYRPWHFFVGSLTHSTIAPLVEDCLPVGLADFVAAAGEAKPVCIAFGSITQARSAPYQSRAIAAARSLGRTVIVVDPEALQEGVDANDKEVYLTRSVPYRLLFPKCACVVHHGGAGTLQDCLWAGAPQVVAPVLRWSDQPFWASVVEGRGLGVSLGAGGLPVKEIEDWCATLSRVLEGSEGYRSVATDLCSEAKSTSRSGPEAACGIIEEAHAFMVARA